MKTKTSKGKVCRVCGTSDPGAFYQAGSTAIAAGACCRACWVAKSVAWRAANLERSNMQRHRAATISRLGITAEAYDSLVTPDAVCEACGASKGQIRGGAVSQLTVDHDHVTGKVRGLLCHPCNIALGQAGDDPTVLRALADYVERSHK